MEVLHKLRIWLLYLSVFTLPMYMRVNNVLLGLFLLVTLLYNIIYVKPFSLKSVIIRGWPVIVFFVLALLATSHEWDATSYKYLEKYWSFILVPLAILPDYQSFDIRRENVFHWFVWGCVATLIICYGNLGYELIANNESFSDFFAKQHIGYQFVAVADTHPTYLGIFIVASILFLIQEDRINRILKTVLFLFLIVGLFQLANRMTILLFAFFFFFLLINRIKEYRIQLTVLILSVLISSVLFIAIGREYIQDEIFSKEAVTDTKRMERWEVSYEIFKDNPFYGVGFKKVKELRREKYREKNFPLSAESDFNAHNQLLEYMSTNGAIGGFIYVVVLTFLLLISIVRRDSLFTFIFLIFILANLTESTMVRIKGIEFFALFTTLFMCGELRPERNKTYLHPV